MSRSRRCSAPWTLLAATLVLAACHPDYNIPLPNGYFIARVQSGVFGVVRPDHRIVTSSTQTGMAVAVIGDTVVGQLDPEISVSHPHFIVNTRTHEAWTDLALVDYEAKLRDLGVSQAPRLVKVNRATTLKQLRDAAQLRAPADRNRGTSMVGAKVARGIPAAER